MSSTDKQDIEIEDTHSEDSHEDVEEKQDKPSVVEAEVKMYVTQGKFIEIRYGLVSIVQLCMSEHCGLINSGMVKGQEAEKRLEQAHLITEDPNEDEIKHIMSFDTYVAYTEDTNTVTLNLQKLFVVGSTLLADFKYRRQNLAISVSFVENSELIKMTITEFVIYMTKLYARSGKKLFIVDKYVEAGKFLDSLIIRDKYTLNGKVTVPTHLRSTIYSSEMNQEQLLFFMGDAKIPVLASTILSSKKIQEQKPDGGLIDGKKHFTGSTIHSLDDILTTKKLRRYELQSLVDAMLLDNKIKVTGEEILNSLVALGEISESARAEEALRSDCGEFNAGWITAPSTPVGEDQEKQVARKTKFLQKFATNKYLIYYVKSPVTYFFVRSDIGRTYASEKAIKSYIEALPKLFHYIQMMAPGCRKIGDQFILRVKALLVHVGQLLGGNDKNLVSRVQNQLTFNRVVWLRSVEMSKLGVAKTKYLPTSVFVEDPDAYVTKDGKDEDEEVVNI